MFEISTPMSWSSLPLPRDCQNTIHLSVLKNWGHPISISSSTSPSLECLLLLCWIKIGFGSLSPFFLSRRSKTSNVLLVPLVVLVPSLTSMCPSSRVRAKYTDNESCSYRRLRHLLSCWVTPPVSPSRTLSERGIKGLSLPIPCPKPQCGQHFDKFH